MTHPRQQDFAQIRMATDNQEFRQWSPQAPLGPSQRFIVKVVAAVVIVLGRMLEDATHEAGHHGLVDMRLHSRGAGAQRNRRLRSPSLAFGLRALATIDNRCIREPYSSVLLVIEMCGGAPWASLLFHLKKL
jgi:hypothetical protein